MSDFDKYQLRAQFSFESAGDSESTMSRIQNQLKGLISSVRGLDKAANKSGNVAASIAKNIEGGEKAIASMKVQVSGMGKEALQTDKYLGQLSSEVRQVSEETKNINLNGFKNNKDIDKASKALGGYETQLGKVGSGINRNIANEKGLSAQLSKGDRDIQNRIEMLRKQTDAMEASALSAMKGFSDAAFQKGINAGSEMVKVYADFDDKMAAVGAVSRASAGDLELLRGKAKELGATTAFTSSQAAEGQKYLAAAGFNASQILTANADALSLASAGQLDLGKAADISSNVLSGFKLKVEQLGHVTDVMALTAASSNTDISQLGKAMSYAAPPAALFGANIEKTSALIGAMSDAGIQSSKAGSSLRSMFLRLADPPADAAKALEQLGVAIADPDTGKLRDISLILGDLSRELKLDPKSMSEFSTFITKVEEQGGDLESAMAQLPEGLHNQQEAVSALNAIFGKTGVSGAAAAIAGLDKVNAMALAGTASSVNLEKAIATGVIPASSEMKKAMELSTANKTSFFAEFSKLVPDVQAAEKSINEAVVSVTKADFSKTLDRSQVSQLSEYFKTVDEFKGVDFSSVKSGSQLFDSLINATDDSSLALSKMRSGLQQFGIELPHQQGAAKQMAATMEDNLAGSFRALGSALEAVQLGLIEPLAPILRGVVDGLKNAALFVANLPGPIRTLISLTAVLGVGLTGLTSVLIAGRLAMLGWGQAQLMAASATLSLQKGIAVLKGLKAAMMGFNAASALASIVPVFGAIATGIHLVTAALWGFALTPIGAIIVGIIGAIALLEVLTPKFSVIGFAFKTLLSPFMFMGGVAVGIIKEISLMIWEVIKPIGKLISFILPIGEIGSAIGDVFGALFGSFKAGENIGKNFVKVVFWPLLTALKAFKFTWDLTFGNTFKLLKWIIGGTFGLLSNLGKGIKTLLFLPFEIALKGIRGLWDMTFGKIGKLFGWFGGKAQETGEELPGALAENSPGPTFVIRERWMETIKSISEKSEGLPSVLGSVGDRIREGWGKVSGFISKHSPFSPEGGIVNQASSMRDRITNLFQSFKNRATENNPQVLQNLKNSKVSTERSKLPIPAKTQTAETLATREIQKSVTATGSPIAPMISRVSKVENASNNIVPFWKNSPSPGNIQPGLNPIVPNPTLPSPIPQDQSQIIQTSIVQGWQQAIATHPVQVILGESLKAIATSSTEVRTNHSVLGQSPMAQPNPFAGTTLQGAIVPNPIQSLPQPEPAPLGYAVGGWVNPEGDRNKQPGQSQSTQSPYAAGGWVSGPGTATSDSIPARLSNGEFVVRAAMASKHSQLLQQINDGKLPERPLAILPPPEASNQIVPFRQQDQKPSIPPMPMIPGVNSINGIMPEIQQRGKPDPLAIELNSEPTLSPLIAGLSPIATQPKPLPFPALGDFSPNVAIANKPISPATYSPTGESSSPGVESSSLIQNLQTHYREKISSVPTELKKKTDGDESPRAGMSRLPQIAGASFMEGVAGGLAQGRDRLGEIFSSMLLSQSSQSSQNLTRETPQNISTPIATSADTQGFPAFPSLPNLGNLTQVFSSWMGSRSEGDRNQSSSIWGDILSWMNLTGDSGGTQALGIPQPQPSQVQTSGDVPTLKTSLPKFETAKPSPIASLAGDGLTKLGGSLQAIAPNLVQQFQSKVMEVREGLEAIVPSIKESSVMESSKVLLNESFEKVRSTFSQLVPSIRENPQSQGAAIPSMISERIAPIISPIAQSIAPITERLKTTASTAINQLQLITESSFKAISVSSLTRMIQGKDSSETITKTLISPPSDSPGSLQLMPPSEREGLQLVPPSFPTIPDKSQGLVPSKASASQEPQSPPVVNLYFSFSGDINLKGASGPEAANEFFDALGPSLNRKVREILRDMVDKMK